MTKRLLIAHFAFFAMTAPGSAGQISWPEAPGVILDHPPNQLGGPSSDTEFIGGAGIPTWQQLADDFVLSQAATLRRVSFHGFYGGTFDPPPHQPPASETMRVRLYDARPSDDLPGIVLFEETFVDPLRTATGDFIFLDSPHPEFEYQVDLSVPFQLGAGTQYWIEIVQIGNVNSLFRWETAVADLNGIAFLNPQIPDWQPALTSDLAFRLSSIPEPRTLTLSLISLLACSSLTRMARQYKQKY